MPDIQEPYPIKPVWPTRPKGNSGKRKPEQRPGKENEKGRKDFDRDEGTPDERPHIDDYA